MKDAVFISGCINTASLDAQMGFLPKYFNFYTTVTHISPGGIILFPRLHFPVTSETLCIRV